MDCGATCLRIIAKHYGRNLNIRDLRQATSTTREGASLLGISEAAEKLGFRTLGVKVSYDKLSKDGPLPCIAHWNQNHFVVIYKIKKNKVYISDPGHGLLKYSKDEFLKNWVSGLKSEGVLLLIDPTPNFYIDETEIQLDRRDNISFLYDYLKPHRKLIKQLIIGLLSGSILQFIFPFLTQSIVDIGIQNNDINFIYLILFAQLAVFFGKTTIEILRNYILMHISSRMNISLVSDFFIKLMQLPIAYYDIKMTGDIMQRINDNRRIEQFLTGASLSTMFSIFNFVVFSVILAFYSIQIFLIFLSGTILYFFWILFFLKKRAAIDYKRFNQGSRNQSKIIELINGMQEIKLHNAEREKRWQWEVLQVKLFKINLKGLSLTTTQNSGSSLINELKNILITFLAAKLVIDGQITLGMMLSISYITGQLNAPVLEMVRFVQHWQDAKISIDRLSEIHNMENEEKHEPEYLKRIDSNSSYFLKNVSFKYEGINNSLVINDMSIELQANKITAIVGTSGSGKSTLLKLLLKYYNVTEGSISIGSNNLKNVSANEIRNKCGVVMQDGYIFSDTIANNIAIGVNDRIDIKQLDKAVKIANIHEFINNLPLGYNTKIGMEGTGLSAGQKQRILIARAVYKNPDYVFFDEATSALDANNEKTIMDNLKLFFVNRTVVIVAHRLSTVINADQILVLENGKIIEYGNHKELSESKGVYYQLVKNQLELGN